MADPISLMAVSTMAATAIGGGVSAFGAYQGGQAQKAYYNYQAAVAQQQAQIANLKATRDFAAGEQSAQAAGIRTAQTMGGFTAGAGARNVQVAGGSTAQVLQSQRAAGLEEQATARQTAAERAYGEQVEAAAKTASAGALGMAGAQAATAGEISMFGDVATTAGQVGAEGLTYAKTFGAPTATSDASSVNPKWYPNPDSALGQAAYSSSIFS